MEEKLQITPLIDIAFLVLIFFMALPMRRLDGKLQAYLPTENGIITVEAPPREIVRIRVRDTGFQLGDHRAESAWDLAGTLRKLGPENNYQIRAFKDIGTQRVLEVVDVLAGLRYTHVEFEGTPSPPNRIRSAVPLPR